MQSARLFLVCAAVNLAGAILPVGNTSAEEVTCQSLASWYAANPSQLDPGSLAALRSCVDQTMDAKIQQQQRGDWPEGSETQRRDRGGWPTPPAWGGEKIESKPWGQD